MRLEPDKLEDGPEGCGLSTLLEILGSAPSSAKKKKKKGGGDLNTHVDTSHIRCDEERLRTVHPQSWEHHGHSRLPELPGGAAPLLRRSHCAHT